MNLFLKAIITILSLLLVFFVVTRAKSQEQYPSEPWRIVHQHGVTVPDWYDPACCNQNDCTPVQNNDDLEFGQDYVLHKPSNTRFMKSNSKWLSSKDERYHVCIVPNSSTPLCLYIPTMT